LRSTDFSGCQTRVFLPIFICKHVAHALFEAVIRLKAEHPRGLGAVEYEAVWVYGPLFLDLDLTS
jgi:hypothetical protein